MKLAALLGMIWLVASGCGTASTELNKTSPGCLVIAPPDMMLRGIVQGDLATRTVLENWLVEGMREAADVLIDSENSACGSGPCLRTPELIYAADASLKLDANTLNPIIDPPERPLEPVLSYARTLDCEATVLRPKSTFSLTRYAELRLLIYGIALELQVIPAASNNPVDILERSAAVSLDVTLSELGQVASGDAVEGSAEDLRGLPNERILPMLETSMRQLGTEVIRAVFISTFGATGLDAAVAEEDEDPKRGVLRLGRRDTTPREPLDDTSAEPADDDQAEEEPAAVAPEEPPAEPETENEPETAPEPVEPAESDSSEAEATE